MTTADTGPPTYRASGRTRPTRLHERVGYDAAQVHAVLDEAFVCHVGFVADGLPVVLPHVYARVGSTLYLHGSTAARAFQVGAAPLEVCVTVTVVDGLVLARSAFHHSLNYRSVVALGAARPVQSDPEKRLALDALVDAVVAGRSEECRRANRKELAATAVLALALDEVSLKQRSGPAVDDEQDLTSEFWAGVLPLAVAAAPPQPDAGVAAPVPDAVAHWRRPGVPGAGASRTHLRRTPETLSAQAFRTPSP